MDVDCNGGPRRLESCIGRQNPPARSRGCSTPARNGAAEPRASPLYIGGGAELRRSCAPPRSRLPPPPARAHAREEVQAKGKERLSAGASSIGPPERLRHKLDSQSVGHQAEECRRAPQGSGGRHVAEPIGCAEGRRLQGKDVGGGQHPLPTSLSNSLPRPPGPGRPATAKLGQVGPFVAPPQARPAGPVGPRGRRQPRRQGVAAGRRRGMVLHWEAAQRRIWVLGPSRGDPVSPRLGVGEDVIRGVTPHPGN